MYSFGQQTDCNHELGYQPVLVNKTNKQPTDNQNETMPLFPIKASATKFLFADGCPDGYYSEDGVVPGLGQLASITSTMPGCAEECTKAGCCCSFEFSHTDNMCNLNTDCQPSAPAHQDYYFCVKENAKGVYVYYLL